MYVPPSLSTLLLVPYVMFLISVILLAELALVLSPTTLPGGGQFLGGENLPSSLISLLTAGTSLAASCSPTCPACCLSSSWCVSSPLLRRGLAVCLRAVRVSGILLCPFLLKVFFYWICTISPHMFYLFEYNHWPKKNCLQNVRLYFALCYPT